VPLVTVWVGTPKVTTELVVPLAAQDTGTVPVGAYLVQLPYTKGYCVVAMVAKLLMKPASGQPRVDRHCHLVESLA